MKKTSTRLNTLWMHHLPKKPAGSCLHILYFLSVWNPRMTCSHSLGVGMKRDAHMYINPLNLMWETAQEEEKAPLETRTLYSTSSFFSFPDLYSTLLAKELLCVSAGYKCLMYLDPPLQDRGNKVHKYKRSPGAALGTPLRWNTYCKIVTLWKKKQRMHEKRDELGWIISLCQ